MIVFLGAKKSFVYWTDVPEWYIHSHSAPSIPINQLLDVEVPDRLIDGIRTDRGLVFRLLAV